MEKSIIFGQKDESRLRAIQQVLFGMVRGKFGRRIPRSDADDLIESIIVLINLMGEEMRETLQLYVDLQQHIVTKESSRIIFMLNNYFEIEYVSPDVFPFLGYSTDDLYKKSFSFLLSHRHLDLWRSTGRKIVKSKQSRELSEIVLLSKDKEERVCRGSIDFLYNSQDSEPFILIQVTDSFIRGKIVDDEVSFGMQEISSGPPNVLARPRDRKILKAIHDYILKHLERPLPGLRVLAHQFGTNEFKLKYGFKQLYGLPVFAFQKRERLRKGQLLIENTNLSVKVISSFCGYKNAAHFGKDFKKEFGVSPGQYRASASLGHRT